ncbi:conserved membrane hypothetical protein [Candidatus Zixiibacteriota bacterium]|nr:conserved membrane hypothetical protein [candidate division Zixibacteria bacterium]
MKPERPRRIIGIFAVASFLNDLGSDMIYPIWPLFVTSVLGANMAVLGFIDGLGDAIVSISQAASGYISDRIKRRKIFISVGYALGAISRVGYGLSRSWPQLIPIRILDRSGKIRSAPRDAIIADISVRENRGGNFGILRAMDNLGAVCGILASIALLPILGYRKIFFLAALPSVLAVLLITFGVKEQRDTIKTIYKGMRLRDLNPNFRLFLIASAIFSLGAFSYSFLLIFAEKNGFRMTTVPALYLLFTAVAFVTSIPFGRLADRIGRKKVIGIAFLLWGLVSVCLLMEKSLAVIIIAFVLYGMHRGALDTVQKAFVSELCPAEYRASALGGFQMVIGLGALPASFIAGILWDKVGPAAPFLLSLSLTAVALILMVFVKEKEQPPF